MTGSSYVQSFASGNSKKSLGDSPGPGSPSFVRKVKAQKSESVRVGSSVRRPKTSFLSDGTGRGGEREGRSYSRRRLFDPYRSVFVPFLNQRDLSLCLILPLLSSSPASAIVLGTEKESDLLR